MFIFIRVSPNSFKLEDAGKQKACLQNPGAGAAMCAAHRGETSTQLCLLVPDTKSGFHVAAFKGKS